MKGTSIFCKVFHKHESKPKVVNARVRQIASVCRSSPEFAKVRRNSPELTVFMSTGHKSGGPANNIENGTSGTLQDPRQHWKLSAKWSDRKELDRKDWKEILEIVANTAKGNDHKSSKPCERRSDERLAGDLLETCWRQGKT